jgi:hypothetical protein
MRVLGMSIAAQTWKGSIFVFLVLLGCARKIDRTEVIGTYIANHGRGTDKIELHADGTYAYECRLSDGESFRNNNRWTFYSQSGFSRITFDQFQFCLEPYRRTKGYWEVEVENPWIGHPRLCLDPDLHYYYIRE